MNRLREFLPDGAAYASLQRIVRIYVQQDMNVELKLLLDPRQANGIRLTTARQDSTQLGWTTWLSQPHSQCSVDAIVLRFNTASAPKSSRAPT